MPTLALLGPPLLVDDAGGVVTGRPVQRHCLALLALLAAEPRALPRDRAVALLWPESDGPSGRHRLSVALHVLRQRLGEGCILASGDALALPAACWDIDARRFEAEIARGDFEAAHARYAGPLLDGFYLRRAPAFDQWLEGWRERLARRHLAVLEALAEAAHDAGDVARCLDYRRELNHREPCSGARTVALMRSLAAAGSIEGAIRCSRAYVLLVREDYGLDPDPAVLACAEELTRSQARRAEPSPG